MRLTPHILTSAAALAISFAVSAAAYYYRSRTVEINEVMVFCKLQFNAYGCFDNLMSFMESAKKSISVCMPGIQNAAIQGRLVNLMRKKKIQLQIIIDLAGYDSTDFLIKELIDVGAEIKCFNNLPYNMQRKFCIIDDKILMSGTLNWGNDLSSDHWNYVYITSKKRLVEPVVNQFIYMWNQLSPVGTENGNSDSTSESSESHEGRNTENESPTDQLNDSSETLAISPLPDVASLIQEQLTFRDTVTTPEITISSH